MDAGAITDLVEEQGGVAAIIASAIIAPEVTRYLGVPLRGVPLLLGVAFLNFFEGVLLLLIGLMIGIGVEVGVGVRVGVGVVFSLSATAAFSLYLSSIVRNSVFSFCKSSQCKSIRGGIY